MIESIKNLLWNNLREKNVSLVMIFSDEGDILWHRGRSIVGRTILEGEGFSRTFTHQVLEKPSSIRQEDVIINISHHGLTQSAKNLLIKSLLILPVGERHFLYIDSGSRQAFQPEEYDAFRLIGNLLAEMLHWMNSDIAGAGAIHSVGAAMEHIKKLVVKYSVEEDPVLLLGETGVGKSRVASLIHRYSGRTGKFVVADTTTINENLFESEVFGHVKGAFTGAVSNKKGLIQEADGGTLFFDEIAEVPLSFQAKLLRVIEERKYRVLGESCERTANVRILAATNVQLANAIEKKQFREDLFYRLNILTIRIPSLKERKEDIRGIVEANRNLLKGKEDGDGFWDVLNGYEWPGNVRQLLAVIKRAGILCESPVTGQDLVPLIRQDAEPGMQVQNYGCLTEIWTALREGQSFWDVVKQPFLDRELNRAQVKALIAGLHKKAGGKYTDMLPLLNLEPSEYRRFMKFLHKNRLQL